MHIDSQKNENDSPNVEITEVTFKTVKNGRDGLLGWAGVTIGRSYRLNQIAIREGANGLYVTFPAKRLTSGERRYHHFPVTRAAAEAVKNAILAHLASLAKVAAEGGAQAT